MPLSLPLSSAQVIGFNESKRSMAFWIALSSIWAILLSLVVVWIGPSVIQSPTDTFILLDEAGRILQGEVPHQDFSNPIGIISYGLIAVGMTVAGSGIQGIVWGSVILLLVIALWATWVGYSRLEPWLACSLIVFLSVLCVGTRSLGYPAEEHSYAMFYNRVGWVLIGILFVQSLIEPRTNHKYAGALEMLSFGLLVGILFFTKITFGLVAIGTVAFAMVFRPGLLRKMHFFLFGLGGVILAIWMVTGVNIVDYLKDIEASALVQSPGRRIRIFAEIFKGGIFQMALLSLAWLLIVGRTIYRKGLSRDTIKFTLQFALVCIGSILLSSGDTGERSDVPGYGFAALLLAYWSSQYGIDTGKVLKQFSGATVIFLFALIAGRDLVSIADSADWRSYRISGVPESQRFMAPRLHDFVVPNSSKILTTFWRADYVPARINEGMELIRPYADGSTHLFVFAIGNPFSFALDLPGPRNGAPLWWDHDMNYNETTHPNAEMVFNNIDLVMVPIYATSSESCCKQNSDSMMHIYRNYLNDHYKIINQSKHWKLYKKY